MAELESVPILCINNMSPLESVVLFNAAVSVSNAKTQLSLEDSTACADFESNAATGIAAVTNAVLLKNFRRSELSILVTPESLISFESFFS